MLMISTEYDLYEIDLNEQKLPFSKKARETIKNIKKKNKIKELEKLILSTKDEDEEHCFTIEELNELLSDSTWICEELCIR